MNKKAFMHAMNEGGDCYINYISPVSKKFKYHVATINFSKEVSPYIHAKSKVCSYKVQEGQELVFCYDLDDFKSIELSQVINIVPLNVVVRQPFNG